MRRKSGKSNFWTLLSALNLAALLFPVYQYAQAEMNDGQTFALVLTLGVVFLLLIIDSISIIVAYFQ